jgi:hypothetical protein
MTRLKRWLKRLLIIGLVVAGIPALLFYASRGYLKHQGNRELEQVGAGLDASDPGWRLSEIQAARERNQIPPDQDASAVVLRAEEMGRSHWEPLSANVEWNDIFPPSNRTPRFQNLVGLAGPCNPTAEARQYARTNLLHRTAGRYPLTLRPNPYLILLPHVPKARFVASLLEYDGLLAGLEGDADRGIRAARSCLNAGRSIGDEPFLVSQLSRMACGNVACRSAMVTLAWSEPRPADPETDANLAAFQNALTAEADTPWFLLGVRGERALAHQFFEGLESGQITPKEVFDIIDNGPPAFLRSPLFPLYRGFLPGDHAECLRIMTAYVEAAKLPPEEQRAALRQIKIPPGPPDNFGYLITRLIVPACEKVAEAGLRVRAELLCAAAAIACERFRLATGRWPQTLDEIPKTILPAVPSDPFTGTPIRYEWMRDGVAIFSIGPEGLDPSDPAHRQMTGPYHGRGLGWRLWNPEVRGLPPEYHPPAELPEAIEEPKDP